MKLLIDIGNTATKIACSDNESFYFLGRLFNKDISEKTLLEFLNIEKVDSIYLSSVAPHIQKKVEAIVKKKYGVNPISISTRVETNIKIKV